MLCARLRLREPLRIAAGIGTLSEDRRIALAIGLKRVVLTVSDHTGNRLRPPNVSFRIAVAPVRS